MPAYRMVYGDDEQVVRETYQDVQVDREDGWTVLFRGNEAILRVRDDHVQSLELLDEAAPADVEPRETGHLTVGDLVRPAVTSVERDAHLAAATYLFKKAGDNALVVIDDSADRVPLTVITDSEVAQAVADGRDPNEIRISDLVRRDPMTLSPATGVAVAAELMLSSGVMYMPVVDGNRLLGIVDISDVCRGLLTTRG
jgi:signal-transduction protein with cAMP-binding, CBS, and nucleotidyltransferase domain